MPLAKYWVLSYLEIIQLNSKKRSLPVSYTHLDVYKRQGYCHAKHSEWSAYVGKIEEWLNCTTHESTGFTPYELVKGTRPPRILEQLFNYPPESNTRGLEVKLKLANENLLTKGERRKQRHNAKGKWTKYEVGQLVLVRRHDLSSAQDKDCLLYTSRCV